MENIEKQIEICTKLYNNYAWLINCYVVDFFTEDHWNKLTPCWKDSLEDLSPEHLAQLLNYETPIKDIVLPLSILALQRTLQRHSLPRGRSRSCAINSKHANILKDNQLDKIFWKNVKAKKRHEISVMSQICDKASMDTNCFYVVDIGAGLGHLSRLLNYAYKLKVCTIEAQKVLTIQAKQLDIEFENKLTKKSILSNSNKTVHINMRIESDITPSQLLEVVKSAFTINSDNFKFGIVGLHPCGDLAATLLKLYNNCDNISFINLVGCCYMKLSTSSPNRGFPLSNFSSKLEIDLSYHAREIACHAIENYVQKLKDGECWKLKIHNYRAILENILVGIDSKLQHSAINNVKYSEDLSFESYCIKAVQRLQLTIPTNKIKTITVNKQLTEWKRVVVFYSLRLLFAPLIETIILLDRLLFLKESGSKCKLVSVFDPMISPRTHVLIALKPESQ